MHAVNVVKRCARYDTLVSDRFAHSFLPNFTQLRKSAERQGNNNIVK